MSAAHFMDALARQSLWLSALVILTGLMQRVLLRRFGAGPVLAGWWLVPLGLLATWLPVARWAPELPLVRWLQSPIVVATQVAGPHPAPPPSSWPAVAAAVAVLWALGAMSSLALAWRAQQQYLHSLRRDHDGTWRSPAGSSPAEAGVWRSLLVLPQDFEQRFSAAEQTLVLAHEVVHHRRHDNGWRLLALLLCTLHWFNPLAWRAARRLRQHQELACDAAVLRQQPQALAAYANALLKSHTAVSEVPIASSAWQSNHPLLERVRMLELHTTHASRRTTGRWLASALAVLGAGAVYATHVQPPEAAAQATASVMLTLNLANDGLPGGSPQVLTKLGQLATVKISPKNGEPGATWEIDLRTTQLADGRLQVESHYRTGEPAREVAPHTQVVAQDETFEFIVSNAGHVLSGNLTPHLLAAR
ncbi:MAG TPA: M56 family metallopeptidase [Ideonella sp.]|uniref:M56 family metallopeptidase n=1 Tax=Ideonella sp. TaxID=1929293 RepID=UPI002CF5FEEE|nr:M56 family metallopeptidase [Ideonella sp.]HSI51139.1 M56 family metallopeptidase [Ideonella sp.]